MAAEKKLVLKSSDGEDFEVDEAVAMESLTIKHMIEDGCADGKIPVQNVDGKMLAKVIEYCQKRVEIQKPMDEDKKAAEEEGLKAWEAEYVNVDNDVLYDLIMAANYMDIKALLDLTTQKVVDLIKGKPVEEIRKIFNIKNDFTPEEEEKIRNDNKWAFE